MHKFKTYFLMLLILLIAFNFAAIAQDESHVTAQLIFPVEQMAKQNSYQVLIKIDITEPWHINSSQPLATDNIRTAGSFHD